MWAIATVTFLLKPDPKINPVGLCTFCVQGVPSKPPLAGYGGGECRLAEGYPVTG
jgi:hypothetical protein